MFGRGKTEDKNLGGKPAYDGDSRPATTSRSRSPYCRRMLTVALQVALALALLAYLIVNTVVDVARLGMFYTTVSTELIPSLPVPAFTLCSDEVDYNFQCTLYGSPVGPNSPPATPCGGLIRFVDVSNRSDWNGIMSKCWAFGSTNSMLSTPPPVPQKNWTAFHSPLVIQYSLVNASTLSLMSFGLWNPFNTPSGKSFNTTKRLTADEILDPYVQTPMDACKERVYTFYWNKHVFLNGTERWDVNWRTEFGVSSNALGTNTSAVGVVHLKPGTFLVPVTRDLPLFPSVLPVLTTFFVLLAALYTCCWLPMAGRGKYRPWGWIQSATGYTPHKYIRPAMPTLRPTVDDIMRVYLYDSEKCEIN